MIRKYLDLLIRYSRQIPAAVADRIWGLLIAMKANVHRGGKLIIRGRPLIDICEGATLHLGDGVTLNSRNRGYHINMHSPVKLFADMAGAEIRIGDNSRIHGTCIHAFQSVRIGRNCLIAANCQIIDGNGHDLSFPDVENRLNISVNSSPIVIEDNVWIGANSIILPGVKIGMGSVISANSVVVKDIPPSVLAGGNPAKLIKDYSQITG